MLTFCCAMLFISQAAAYLKREILLLWFCITRFLRKSVQGNFSDTVAIEEMNCASSRLTCNTAAIQNTNCFSLHNDCFVTKECKHIKGTTTTAATEALSFDIRLLFVVAL